MHQEGDVATFIDHGRWTVHIKGQFTETLELPAMPIETKEIFIDFDELTYINSSGVRNWLQWTKALIPPISLAHVPLAFLRLLKVIEPMVPINASVENFDVSYACLDCGKLYHVELENDASVINSSEFLTKAITPPCEACNFETELELPTGFYSSLIRYSPK